MKSFIFLITILSTSLYAESLCIAHRGDSGAYLENSLSAIKSAVLIEADGIEFDLRHTSDNQAILMHDSTLKRTAKSKEGKSCPLKSKISKLTLREILENCELKNGEAIPTFEEVLAVIPKRIKSIIEFKDKPSKNTLNLIKENFLNFNESLKIISFKRKTLKRLRKSEDTFFRSIKYLNLNFLFVNPFSKIETNVFHKSPFIHWLPKLFKDFYAIWTVNSKKDILKSLKKNTPMITTNFPELCMELKK